MHLFALVLGIWLLPKGDTLTCWGYTEGISLNFTQRVCPSPSYQCGAFRLIAYIGGLKLLDRGKFGCFLPDKCGEGSVRFGLFKAWVNTQCCNNDNCNNQWVQEPNKTTPNGRQCFTCDGSTCDKTLACEGNEDHCFTTSVDTGGTTTTVNGCASELMCSASNSFPPELLGTYGSCCKDNLCNRAVTATAVTTSAVTTSAVTARAVTATAVTATAVTATPVTATAVTATAVTATAVTATPVTATAVTATAVTATPVTATAVTATPVTATAVTASAGLQLVVVALLSLTLFS